MRKSPIFKTIACSILCASLLSGALILPSEEACARNNNRLRRRNDDSGAGKTDQSNLAYPNQFQDQNQEQDQYQLNPQSQPGPNGEDFNVGIRHDVLDGSAEGRGLTGGAGQGTLQGGASGSGLQMQSAVMETRKPLSAGTTSFAPLIGGITKVEVERLQERDVILIIDRSASMSKMDCPPVPGAARFNFGTISRWDWCRDQTRNLASLTGSYNRGIKLIMFSRGFETFPDVTPDQVSSLFQRYQPNPDTGTDMVDPLRAVLGNYIKQRNARQNPRPLAIAVIFDGLARKGSLSYLADAIVDASRVMREPDEIQITIFIVGNRGPRVIQPVMELENTVRRQGARYNILRVIPFNQVQRVGLAKGIAATLKDD